MNNLAVSAEFALLVDYQMPANNRLLASQGLRARLAVSNSFLGI